MIIFPIIPKNWFKRNLLGTLTLCMFMPIMMPHGCSTASKHEKHKEKTIVIENKICPISDKKIDEKTKVTYEYEGKIYDFCCPMCIDEFKKDPQKYIKKIEKQGLEKSNAKTKPKEGHQHNH